MPSYQEFAKKARERFQQSQGEKKKPTGAFQLTHHAEYKMKQYGLSLQKIKGVIRSPRRIEKGIAGNSTIAVMQPVSPKKEEGKAQETWKQEIWVMYQKKLKIKNSKLKINAISLERDEVKIISAWRYPGVSPERNPIPSEILLELEDELT